MGTEITSAGRSRPQGRAVLSAKRTTRLFEGHLIHIVSEPYDLTPRASRRDDEMDRPRVDDDYEGSESQGPTGCKAYVAHPGEQLLPG